MNSLQYQEILDDNVMQSKLRMGRTLTIQHDNDPKHKVKSTGHWMHLLTTISLSHSGEISNVQFMQDSPRIYRNWRLFAKKNGQLYHLSR
uniref:Uncharacterized protein n=1 Tax=Leptobrachium leishanense TaxID=445787 RepID=A0A8C5M6A4_9ANUR